jgi:parallel beta-helix repeat protein
MLVILFLLLLPRLKEETVENKAPISEVITEREALTSNKAFNSSKAQAEFKASSLPLVYCTGRYSDSGEDLDNTSLFNQIVLFVQINVTADLTSFWIDLHIHPIVKGESQSPISIEHFNYTSLQFLNIGIRNVSIPFISAESFLTLGHDCAFHIEEITIRTYAPIFTVNDPYTTREYSREEFDHIVLITGRIWDKGDDTDFNWYYDNLVTEIEVKVVETGEYRVEIEMVPATNDSTGVLQGVNQSFLEEGLNIISIHLDAILVRDLRINGSLVITQIEVLNRNTNAILDRFHPDYLTQVYSFTDFDVHQIKINGNEEFAQSAKDLELPGDGSSLNPYIIDGLVINDAGSQNIINIENVDVSFQITNNILHGGVIAIKLSNLAHGLIADNSLLDNQIGVHLNNVNQCIIQHNTISGHNEGVTLIEADENLIERNSVYNNSRGIQLANSDSNLIINNSITNNNGTDILGIGILIANESANNFIMRNDFRNNSYDVYDSGLNTSLSSNYWANWTGEGYYWVPGELYGNYLPNKNRDPTPSELPNHLPKPLILFPLKGETVLDPVLIIKWTAVDTLGHELTYDIYFSVDDGINWTLLSTGETESLFEWDIRNVTKGLNYRIKIVAYDSFGFTSWEISDEFTIQIPSNPIPVVGSFFGTILLIFVCIGLLIKFK